METLREANRMARSNGGAPGIDGVTFAAIEESGAQSFLGQIREELVHHTYRPMRGRKKEIPKDGGKKVRVLTMPAIRDRVRQYIPAVSEHLLLKRPPFHRDRTVPPGSSVPQGR